MSPTELLDNAAAQVRADSREDITVLLASAGLLLAEALEDHAYEHNTYECGWSEPCALVRLARLIVGEQS